MSNNLYIMDYQMIKESNNGDSKFVLFEEAQENLISHQHLFFEIVYIKEGETTHVLNGQKMSLHKGHYFFMDYDSVHGYADAKGLRLINFLFLPEFLDDILINCRSFDELMRICMMRYYKQYMGSTAVNQIFYDEDGKIMQLIIQAQEEYEGKNIGYEEVIKCKFLEMLILTMRKVVEAEQGANGKELCSQLIRKVKEHIGEHYSDKAVLSDFCRIHHYNLQYVSRRFRKETGYTVKEYVQRTRLEKSCELLRNSTMSVRDIAGEVGYDDVRSFSTLFRNYFRMTPREYRKQTIT